MDLTLFGHNVAIKLFKNKINTSTNEQESNTLILTRKEPKSEPVWYTVVHVGEHVHNIHPGDIVIVRETQFRVPLDLGDGEELIIIDDTDILGKAN